MPARISIIVDGKPQFDRTFSRLDERFDDLTPIWDDVRDAVWNIVSDQFQSGGAAGASGRWQELSKRYEAQKIARYGTFALLAGTLRATEAMYKAYTRQTSDTIYRTTKHEMVLGAGGEVGKRAAYHQRGGGRLPKREIFSFSDKQEEDLQKTIQRGLVRELRQGSVYVEQAN